jgi:hypothetical protein
VGNSSYILDVARFDTGTERSLTLSDGPQLPESQEKLCKADV